MNSKALVSAFFSTILFIIVLLHNSQVRAEEINLETLVSQHFENPLALKISITNQSNKEIRIWEHQLPWNSYLTFHLIGISLDNKFTQLKQMQMISDPGVVEIVLKPKESISGIIHLDLLYPNIINVLKNNDIGLFWTYKQITLNNVDCLRQGGFLLIRKP